VRKPVAIASVVAAALGLAAAVALAALPGGNDGSSLEFAPAAPSVTREVSSNWSGYVATNASFSSVTATWTQPRAVCGSGDAGAASAFWVGLGGYTPGSQTLHQIGTDSDCDDSNQPSYYAWYEIIPAPPVKINLKIFPGNVITTSVNVKGTEVIFQIKNRSRNTVFTTRQTLADPDLTSAEWIAEAPALCSQYSCRPVPLANFGSVVFTKVAALANGYGGTLTQPSWTIVPIQLVPRVNRGFAPGPETIRGGAGSTAGAAPAPVSSDGTSFSVSWQENATISG
jgi:hypothetical protein